MSTAAAVIQLFPEPTVESLAAEYLKAKRAAAEAEECVKALGPKLIAAMTSKRQTTVAVGGVGAVTAFETQPQMRLDTKTATAILQAHELEVPLSPTGGGHQLRATMAKR